jgi:hypothetical protein
MKLIKLVAGLAMACLLLSVAGCTTTGLVSAVGQATGVTIPSSKALAVADSLRTAEDLATTYISGCVAAKSHTGACAYGDTVYNDAKAANIARDNLLAFIASHGDVPLGVGGVYDAATTALSTLQSVLTQTGVYKPAANS